MQELSSVADISLLGEGAVLIIREEEGSLLSRFFRIITRPIPGINLGNSNSFHTSTVRALAQIEGEKEKARFFLKVRAPHLNGKRDVNCVLVRANSSGQLEAKSISAENLLKEYMGSANEAIFMELTPETLEEILSEINGEESQDQDLPARKA